jgi:hypothetical protein
MRVRALIGLAAIGGAVVVAGIAAVGSLTVDLSDVADADGAVETVGTQTVAAPKQDRETPAPVTASALFDSSLLSPQPMLGSAGRQVPNSRPVEVAALAYASAAPEAAREITASIRPVPPPTEAKRNLVPPPRLEKDGTLSVEQIARIKQNLNLTPEQEQYWPPVEAELRAIARQMAAEKAAGKPKATITAETAQRLYWAAGPLIMSLRDDQKQEVRRLARNMGLTQVASLI